MTTIIERLLEWCSSLGTSVILLSATLPKERRARLAEAYAKRSIVDSAPDSYPSLWIVGHTRAYIDSPPAFNPVRKIQLNTRSLHFTDEQFDEKARWLVDAVKTGGCVCWMTNTVRRAQALFNSVDKLASEDIDRTLIHAQFPLDQRQRLEKKINIQYGPEGSHRPAKGIVIGTQVLEQSLDLDFDLLVSDLAPVDLLLQRAGRLHRHQRQRPMLHQQPRLWLNTQIDENGVDLRVDRFIYAEYFLLKTWEVLENIEEVNLPSDYRPLIEAVYQAEKSSVNARLIDAWEALKRDENIAREAACQCLLPEPNPHDCFSGPAAWINFKESETESSWIIARTRLGEESLTIVPLEKNGENAWTIVDGEKIEINLAEKIIRAEEFKLLRGSLTISNRRAVEALKMIADQEKPTAIKEAVLLKDVHILWMNGGKATLKYKNFDIQFILDSRLGLVIKTEKGA